MMVARYTTAESVTEGHPDKVCDQISDAVLDAHLAQDPMARVAAEVMVSGNMVHVAGEVTSRARIDVSAIVREVTRRIGYTDPDLGFDADSCFILVDLHEQSPDIAQGVVQEKNFGAGDQGTFYGYATDETESLMPVSIDFAHRLTRRLAEVRKNGLLPWLRPDGKAQVTFAHDAQGRPEKLISVVVSTQHSADIEREQLLRGVLEEVIVPVMGRWLTRDTRVLINPTGRFVKGGPAADTGLTGRKIIVDTYGGIGRHGGGAFSGKDATKVDRSGAYMARYIAKNIVAAGLAKNCEISLAFAIGQTEPEMVAVSSAEKLAVDSGLLEEAVRELFPLSVSGMIDVLGLRRPIFEKTASYGHFGRNAEGWSWEQTDRADSLRRRCRR
ncbi:methionine adenosyltransferase [Aliirhizobium smilacinae]|uniref:S-adenosylmethionine synthase n=1 Tax=Aliirhizobium smilacinae TaxID=1395944 RepID=A0A5C4XC85_9HYPH|nr:methionine adenosyltransferase [Rhizobium smilacinae]